MDPPIAVASLWEADSLCRACFKELKAEKTAKPHGRVNIFETAGLLNKLSACVSDIFITTKRCSKYLCVACVERVNEFYEFRKMCLQSISRFEETRDKETITSEKPNDLLFSSGSVVKEEYELHDQTLGPNKDTTSITIGEGVRDLPDSQECFNTETDSLQKLNQQKTAFIFKKAQMYVDDLEASVSVKNEPISNDVEVEVNLDKSIITLSSPSVNNDTEEDVSGEDEQRIGRNLEVNSAAGNTSTYYCDKCPKQFRTEHNFNVHKQRHQGLKPYPCTHQGCGKSFLCLKTLKNHRSRHENQNGEDALKRYLCTYEGCGKSFSWPELLEKHQIKHENNEFGRKRYHCTHKGCYESFCRLDTFKRHQSRHEDPNFKYGPKPYHCTYEGCDKSFAGPRGLREHQKSHGAPKRYPCTHAGCTKSFAWAQSLKKHQTIHGNSKVEYDPKPYHCPHEGCNESFWELLGLNRHRSKHKDPNSEYRYYCEQANCNRGFQSYTGLKTHMLRHDGIKKYECPRCNIRKTTKKELTVHMEKPCPKYPCRFCKEVFNSWDDMITHRQNIHPSTCLKCSYCPQTLYSTASHRRHESKQHPSEKPLCTDG